MSKNLVIVESPAKAKTISRFLGKDYKVVASMGHIRDLPKSDMGVDVDGDFTPTYQVSPDKKKVVSGLRADLKKAEALWLATDEDREGEAIGWHLLHALKVPAKMPVKRIVFHEITKGAITKAIETPREIDQNVVDAQQARRVLDRLVGYELSPLLWKKVRYGLSAGRVQSVAVRLIVEREREIEAFDPEEYWKVLGEFAKSEGSIFEGMLTKFKGKKLKMGSESEVKDILKILEGADYEIAKVDQKDVKRNPAPPFITSTLQQEASRKLNFSVKKTMMVAQQLYEGIDTGGGATGLITYMRTDSVNLSNVALKQAKEVIDSEFGKEYSLGEPRRYKGKKGAQEAHEAIRPVDLSKRPEMLVKYLNKDQIRLYELIWKRTLACQMAQAILQKTGVDIAAKKSGEETGYTFRATGQVVKFAGFIKVYTEGKDDGDEEELAGDKILPPLEEGESVEMKKIEPTQHFTKPPARYTEASLVKTLEAEGIGRPSTYAPTIGTIVARGYVEKDGRALKPTDTAMVVTDLLVEHFKNIVDYKFTADMEDKLDAVEDGEQKWVPMIKDFYKGFHKNVEEKQESLKKSDVVKERVLGKDPRTGLDVIALLGRFGPFVQVGKFTKEEIAEMEEKPRRASLPKGTYLETVTIEEALKALSLPRELGKLESGETVTVMTGRYGPYLKIEGEGKPQNVSLPEDFDPYTVMLGEAKRVIAEGKKLQKKMQTPIAELGKDPASGGDILVKDGRFGPYITDGKTNVSVRKGNDPKEITFEQAVELLAKKRANPGRGRYAKKGKK